MFNIAHVCLFIKTKTIYQNMAKNENYDTYEWEKERMF